MTRTALISAMLACAAAPALAEECRHSAPRSLELDLAGARTVMFEVGPHRLRVDASAAPGGAISGRACARDAGDLDALTVTQQRAGDRLIVRLQREDGPLGPGFGKRGAYLELDAAVPDDLLVQLDVGSGEASVSGVSAASADVGSGDVALERIRGRATVKVGSGDIGIDDAGSLKVISIGSGDVEARNLRGNAEVGSIGSGDFTLHRTAGDASIDSIGSGDAELVDIGGSVRVGSVGSGDLDVRGVGGELTVSSVGSGDVDHSGVRGAVDVPRR